MKAYDRANLKLKLLGMFERGGVDEIRNYLVHTNRDIYLKQHRKFKATLEGAELLCKEILSGRDII